VVFTEMVATSAAKTRVVRPKSESLSNGGSPIATFSAPATKASPLIDSSDLSSLHILAASALESASASQLGAAPVAAGTSTSLPHSNINMKISSTTT